MRLPPLQALRIFEVAARHLSFAKAAAELNLTPSAVSHQIRHLEEVLGTPLFVRRTRSVTLTPAGEAYAPRLTEAFRQIAEATEAVAGRDAHRTLVVSSVPSLAIYWLIPRLSALKAAHPDIEVRLDTTMRSVDLLGEGVDFGVRYGKGTWPGLVATRLFGECLVPVCAPRQRDEAGLVRPADLAHATLLHNSVYKGDWRTWLEAARARGHDTGNVDPEAGLNFDSSQAAYDAAIAGYGVAMGRARMVRGLMEEGRLCAPFDLRIDDENAYFLVHPKALPDDPYRRVFQRWIQAEAKREDDVPALEAAS